MTKSRLNRYWFIIAVVLLIAIVIGGIIVWSRYRPGQLIEISLSSSQDIQGRIYIGGAVTNPGFYPLGAGDSVEALLSAAGGLTANATISDLKLYVPTPGEEPFQKIDINRADVWLLTALPGIGDTLAQRIVDFRRENGPFRNTLELLKVSGVGTASFERIRDLVTVAE